MSTLLVFGGRWPECKLAFDDLVTICRYRSNFVSTAEHGGTHVDAPSHFAKDGMTVHEIPIDKLTGPGCIIDITVSGYNIKDMDYTV